MRREIMRCSDTDGDGVCRDFEITAVWSVLMSVELKEQLAECVEHDGKVIAYIIRADSSPGETTFVTPDDVKQQVGFIVYPKGGEIVRHIHKKMERNLIGMSEVLFVRKGLVEADFYTDDKEYICTKELQRGDLLLLVSGGHGFRCIEDTVLVEIKQGPYIGPDEKERF